MVKSAVETDDSARMPGPIASRSRLGRSPRWMRNRNLTRARRQLWFDLSWLTT